MAEAEFEALEPGKAVKDNFYGRTDDYTRYTLDVVGGQLYRISVASTTGLRNGYSHYFDLYITDSTGEVVMNWELADDLGQAHNDVSFRAEADDTLQVDVVRLGDYAKAYQLLADELTPVSDTETGDVSTTGVLRPGDTISSELEDVDTTYYDADVDWYRIEAEPGWYILEIDLPGTVSVVVVDDTGRALSPLRGPYSEYDIYLERTVFLPGYTGLHITGQTDLFLEVSGDPADYKLELTQIEDPGEDIAGDLSTTAILAVGTSVRSWLSPEFYPSIDGTFDPNRSRGFLYDRDWWRIDVEAGIPVTVALDSLQTGAVMAFDIYDETGRWIRSVFEPGRDFGAIVEWPAGRHVEADLEYSENTTVYVSPRSIYSRPGEYQLSLYETPDGLVLDGSAGDYLLGRKGDDTLIGTDGSDRMTGGPGRNRYETGGGSDQIDATEGDGDILILGPGDKFIRGAPSTIDIIRGFDSDDVLQLSGGAPTGSTIRFERGAADASTLIRESPDGVETISFETLGEGFLYRHIFGEIALRDALPDLVSRHSLASEQITGYSSGGFWSEQLAVTLLDMGYARKNNALGVYTYAWNGNSVEITAVQILFSDANAQKGETVVIDTPGAYEIGESYDFFLVQDGADWASALSETDELAFRDANGSSSLDSDLPLQLAVNGVATGHTVFHTLTQLNPDGVEHVTEGLTEDGTATVVGFEDLWGGGDRDYEDVVIEIDWLVPT